MQASFMEVVTRVCIVCLHLCLCLCASTTPLSLVLSFSLSLSLSLSLSPSLCICHIHLKLYMHSRVCNRSKSWQRCHSSATPACPSGAAETCGEVTLNLYHFALPRMRAHIHLSSYTHTRLPSTTTTYSLPLSLDFVRELALLTRRCGLSDRWCGSRARRPWYL